VTVKAANYAGNQLHVIQHVAAVHGDIVQLLTSDQVGALARTRLQLDLANGTKYPHKGKVIFTDRQIDPQTGTIKLVAAFANPGNILRPGQFGRVHAATAVNRSAILVPQRCVTELQGTYQVAVVGAGNKVSVRTVKLGERVGPMQIIESGVNAGETVISEGNAKVRDGMIVNPTVAKMEGNE